MRVEVNDEASRLRRHDTPTKCANGTDHGFPMNPPNPDAGNPQPGAAHECDDCGNQLLSCRCSPGEG